MARLFKPNTRARAISAHCADGVRTARIAFGTNAKRIRAKARAIDRARPGYALTADQPPLEADIAVEPEAGAPAVEAGGIAAVEAGGIVAVEDCIGVAGAVAAGGAMVEDAAGLSLLSLLPPHAASPTTSADATMIRVSFMGSSPSRGCQ